MNRKKILFVTILIFLMGSFWTTPVGAKMIKEVFLGVFKNAPSQADTDRFYMRYHGPEIMRLSGPWIRRYQLWLPFEPPEEAVERFGAVQGRYGELWYTEEDYLDRPPMRGITESPWGMEGQTTVMVPAWPTEEFYDSDPHPDETPILRWVTVIRYPDGVSEEEGEKWFLEVHAKEALKQPGLLKFVSHKVLNIQSPSLSNTPSPSQSGEMPQMSGDKPPQSGNMPQSSGMPGRKSWVRVCEYWYRDFDAWRKAILESPPKYTAPSWGGEYPFVEMSSTFIPYMNDIDFIKGGYIVP